MSDFAPPSGPPPPHVPEGWKAVWNDQYQEYFYVNLHTKQSTWEKPTEPAYPGHESSDMPPDYTHGGSAPVGAGSDMKKTPLESNNPYGQNVAESDEAFARRLQEEENARRGAGSGDHGGSHDYYGSGSAGYGQNYQQPSPGGYLGAPDYNSQQQQRPGTEREKSGGLFGKLKNKIALGGSSHGRPPGMSSSMLGGMGGGHSQQYGGYPQHGYGGGYPQQGYGGYPQQGYGGGYGAGYGQPMYGQPVRRKGGMGPGGAAALGVGGGLVGGMLLADAIDDHDDYQEGYDDGMDAGDMGDGGGE